MTPLLRKAWQIVALLWFVALLNYLDRLMIVSMREPIKASIAMSDAQFGLLTAVFLWVYGILSPFGGYAADRFGRSKVIIGSLLVWSVVTGLTGCVRSFNELLILRALMGIREACYVPAALALITDYHRDKTRSLATGLHMSGIYAGAALGGIGGYIAEYSGWRTGFLVFGAVGVSYAVLLALFLRDAPKFEEAKSGAPLLELPSLRVALRTLFASTGFWILFVINAMVGTTNWYVNGWLPAYLRDQFHLSLGGAGLSATAYIQIAAFPGVIVGGLLADRWNRTNSHARSLITGIGFAIASPCLFVVASTNLFLVAVAALVFFGFWKSFIDANLMPILREVSDSRFSAMGYGILNFVGCVIGGLMVYVGGIVKDAHISLGAIFEILAGTLVVVSLLFFAIGPCANWRRRSQPDASSRDMTTVHSSRTPTVESTDKR